jgi:hypothetical protein
MYYEPSRLRELFHQGVGDSGDTLTYMQSLYTLVLPLDSLMSTEFALRSYHMLMLLYFFECTLMHAKISLRYQ